MTSFLIDEMFPVTAAELLRNTYGQDAVHVVEVGLRQLTTRRSPRPPGPKAGLSLRRMWRISPRSVT